MKRPYLMLYVADWQSNAKLRGCTRAERDIWLDIMFILHDQEEYGVVRWSLKDIAKAVHAPTSSVRKLADRLIMKGADVEQECEPLIFVPRSGRKEGRPVTLIPAQPGPIWYSSRMVRDEYKRLTVGSSTRFGSSDAEITKPRHGEAPSRGKVFHPPRARASISDPDPEVPRDSEDQINLEVVDAVDRRQRVFDEAGPETRGFPFDYYAVVEYANTLQPEPPLSIFQAETIANNVPDNPLARAVWKDVLRLFCGNGYQPRHAGNAVDRFGRDMAAIAAGKKDSPINSERPKTIKEQMEAGLIG